MRLDGTFFVVCLVPRFPAYYEGAGTGAAHLYTMRVPHPLLAGRTWSTPVFLCRNKLTISLAVRPVVLVFDKYLSVVRSNGHCSPVRYGI